jgi:DNA-directed RNA polymerase subunit M/transcription elongation factor TFIIS
MSEERYQRCPKDSTILWPNISEKYMFYCAECNREYRLDEDVLEEFNSSFMGVAKKW